VIFQNDKNAVADSYLLTIALKIIPKWNARKKFPLMAVQC